MLVRVRAAAVNRWTGIICAASLFVMRLSTGLGTPGMAASGRLAGVVEAVGPKVTRFKPGDEVFGGRSGALAEYVLVSESRNVLHKPANISMEQAGSVAIAGVTAPQALRDRLTGCRPAAGADQWRVGAASGTFAVQIAKSLGAEVTGVCSGRNAELVRSLGADQVIDYTQTDFTEGAAALRFDCRHGRQPFPNPDWSGC